MERDQSLAVFIDFDNMALGYKKKTEIDFDIGEVLGRLVEKGKVIVKKAYADWGRYPKHKRQFHEAAIELIEIPKRGMTGKNSADIRLVVDALDLCYSKDHIDTFVVVSGDSDFSPLISKLKENGKYTIGLGMKDSTSELLLNNCDEFIYYEELKPPPPPERKSTTVQVPKAKQKVFQLLVDSVTALLRENKPILYSSMVKDTMKRKQPSFNESSHGYRTFSELLEDAERHKLVVIQKDQRSGTYVVSGFAK